MKKLITHPRPHLDDICGIWLMKRFMPEWQEAAVDFMSAGSPSVEDADTYMIGIGRGKFDEHKGDVGESATSLVWQHIRGTYGASMDPTRVAALDRLAEWVRQVDTSSHDPAHMAAHAAWLPPEQLRVFYRMHGNDSQALTAFGEEMCDRALAVYESEVRLERDWAGRTEFDTPWGRGVALTTDAHGADDYAYSLGFVLVIYIHPKNGYRGYRAAATSSVDLTATAEIIRGLEPDIHWFLHHSKKLLLSGSDVEPGTALSTLSLQELIGAIR